MDPFCRFRLFHTQLGLLSVRIGIIINIYEKGGNVCKNKTNFQRDQIRKNEEKNILFLIFYQFNKNNIRS